MIKTERLGNPNWLENIGCSLLSVLFVAVPLVYYPHIEDFSNLPKKFILQAFLCFSALLLILGYFRQRRFQWIRHPLWIWVLAWLAWSGLSILWAIDRFSGLYLWFHWTICSIVLVVFMTNPPQKWVDRWIQFSCIGAGIVSFIGCVQYLFGFDGIPQSFVPGVTFSNKNVAAEYAVMLWPMSFITVLQSHDQRRLIFATINSSQIFLFLIYAKTRSVWVAMVFGIVFGVLLALKTGNWNRLKPVLWERRHALACILIFGMVLGGIPPHLKPKDASPASSLPKQNFVIPVSWNGDTQLVQSRIASGIADTNPSHQQPISRKYSVNR
ncbi:MAG: hypothetical protein AB1547_11490 [Thermodesulfobacteriota bacterium]